MAESLGIVGASGFIGRELARQATAAGWKVCGFSRQARGPESGIPAWRQWSDDPDFRGLTALVNLAGEPINKRWTEKNRRLFHESRIGVTETIRRGLEKLADGEGPRVLVNGSAVGIYGDRGDEILEDDASPGSGLAVDLCRDWEAAADEVAALGLRVMKWRTGVVLGRDGAAFKRMVLPFRLGVGGRLGSGRQWMPWIHVEDLAGSILHGIGHPSLVGPVNGSAPEPERNADFTRKLAKALKRPAFMAVPPFALKLALGDFASVILSSQRAVPRALLESGYRFRYPTLDLALEELVGRR
ncbi:TIGR01777 family oxidoreductase [Luteolibacter flavescens]|uniref:TIGR01777 family oxidoreductase n=1 Tax=Luteolibacter flavescens TaxID=1859460 RepID=A0ABT3FQQ1_9BACT|nr:TIGR01777 family oxidoreductase [Luteolibacter flavescens]MCW1885913.1 TIGR01777 family oxidoreductase [Luteolibacter flavescens]